MAKKFPEKKEKNEGKFTAWVEKNMPGKSTCAAASKVMKNTKKLIAVLFLSIFICF